jgi:DHA1 family bicyclomycin/chloramphenicol resistance-like MFS transporter
LSGLVVYAASCLALAFTTSLEVFLALRVVQAVGAGWTFVSIPALVRDRVQGVEAAKLFSLLGLIIVIAPAVAPALGSLLLSVGSWSSIFFFLASYAALSIPLLLVNVFRGEPLLRKPKWLDEPSVSALARYMGVLKHKPARYFIAWQVSAFSVLMLFVTHASFLYQEHFGQSDGMFSLLFGANIVAMFCINLTNRALLSRMEPLRLLQMATALQGFGVVMLVVAALFHWPVYLFVPAMMLAVGSMGAISPNLQACYMEHFPSAGGSAAAVLGAAQFGLAGALSALSALLPHTALAIVLAMAGCASVAVALLVHSRRDASVPLMLVPSPMAQQR